MEQIGGAGEPALIARAREWQERTAIADPEGSRSYGDLLAASDAVARRLLDHLGADGLEGRGIPYLVPPGFSYAAVQWGVWRAGGLAVPLAVSHPPRELAYVLDDARAPLVIADPALNGRILASARERGIEVLSSAPTSPTTLQGSQDLPGSGTGRSSVPRPAGSGGASLPVVSSDRPALMLYTSGTTGRPKGVVHTHGSLEAQVRTLTAAWEWTGEDRILLVLPLHHLHGVMNVLTCALWAGARCSVLPAFDPEETWERIGSGSLTLFMAVPTIYHRLARLWDAAEPDVRERWSEGARGMRLMVSGSAALPDTLLERWRRITGHTLLERYGMTETGMILSNPLHGERRPGHVGQPLPGMEVRMVDEEGQVTDVEGEIQVRSDTLFREYWGRPDATARAHTPDGWFRTGDVARLEDGSYRILGRKSVDILKTGGYKVSALEIESVLLEHPAVAECAVVGAPDPEWGQSVCAALVAAGGHEDDPRLRAEALRAWAKERLAPYKAPTRVVVVESLPRNAMGKVQKPRVVALFEEG